MADERRDSLDQLTDAARAASKVAKIVQAAQAGGAAGAAVQTVKEYHKQAATVIVVVLLLPVLLILSLPAVIFGSLLSPSDTVLTDEVEIAENVIEIKNSIGTVLQTAYEDVLDVFHRDRGPGRRTGQHQRAGDPVHVLRPHGGYRLRIHQH